MLKYQYHAVKINIILTWFFRPGRYKKYFSQRPFKSNSEKLTRVCIWLIDLSCYFIDLVDLYPSELALWFAKPQHNHEF